MNEPGRSALTFVGSGDAFSSGGRLHTCIHVAADGTRFLLDCGASALAGMKRFGVEPLSIETVLITHFHADHFCGLPFLLIESKLRKRTNPLAIAGPPGVADFLDAALRVLFPGTAADFGFAIDFFEYQPGIALDVGPLRVRAFPVKHIPETRPHALRVDVGAQAVGYSGDTEWTDTLLDAARDTDLFVCEAATLDRPVKNHVDYETVRRHRPALACRRLILTHMGPDVIAASDRIRADGAAEPASDGLSIPF